MIIGKIRQYLGLESEQEKVERLDDLRKSFVEVESNLDLLAQDFFIEKSYFTQRMNDPENYVVQDKIKHKFDLFLSDHKNRIKKAKKTYDSFKKDIAELEKSITVKTCKVEAYQKIKKAYQDRKISLDSFNDVIKGITKECVTKYSDFLLFNEKGELLLLKRSQWEEDNKGAWVIPGGHVDPNEDFLSAAIRELREESGFNVEHCENVGSYEDDKCHIEYFRSSINMDEQSPLLDWLEARDMKWVPLDELDGYEMVFNMKENIFKILKLDKQEKTIIRKALELGLISLEQIIEKGRKDVTKLVKKKKLVTREGKSFFMTVYVNPVTGVETVDSEKEVDYVPLVDEAITGDTYYIRSPKVSGECVIDSILLGKDHIPYLSVIIAGEKKVVTAALLKYFKKTGTSTSTTPPTATKVLPFPSASDMTYVRELGGSSGVKMLCYGADLYAVKTAHKGEEKQLIQEAGIAKLYKAMGYNSVDSEYQAGDKRLVSKFIEGASELNAVSITPELKKELQKGYVLDCLLANWDVLGANNDNVLVKAGQVYRIDNGGCMTFRAKGGTKTYGEAVGEIDSMRTTTANGKAIFGSITDDEIMDQIAHIRKNITVIVPLMSSFTTADLDMFGKRLAWLENKYRMTSTGARAVSAPAAPTPPPPPVEVLRPDMPSLETQRYFDSDTWKNLTMKGNKGLKENIKDHIISIENYNKSSYERIAASKSMTIEEVKSKMQKMVASIVARSTGYIVAHSTGGYKGTDVVGLVIGGGRFKSQFETKSSCGSLSPSSRASTEHGYFGFPKTTTAHEDERPIYGFFTDQPNGAINDDGTVPPERRVHQYGDVCFQVKDSKFRKDATITFHDSLGSENYSSASPAGAPHFTSVGHVTPDKYEKLLNMYNGKVTEGLDRSYVETQYHGQLKLSDIEKVHISVKAYTTTKLSRVINEVNAATLKGGLHIPIEMF